MFWVYKMEQMEEKRANESQRWIQSSRETRWLENRMVRHFELFSKLDKKSFDDEKVEKDRILEH